MRTNVKIKAKDRIGLVNEISGIMMNLGIVIIKHGANVSADSRGTAISYFQAQLSADNPETIQRLRKKCEKIKGFISFDYTEAA